LILSIKLAKSPGFVYTLYMRKSRFIYLSLAIAMAAGLAVFATAVCDDDPGFDTFCSAGSLLRYEELFAHILSQKGVFHEYSDDAISPQPIISYLAMQEKSPPVV